MKPLVLYCRWHRARLRLKGRNESSVWGTILFSEMIDDNEIEFSYALKTRILVLKYRDGAQTLHLDDMGVLIESDPR